MLLVIDMSAEAALNLGAKSILLSPGPKTPDEAGICLDVIRQAPDTLPILGICLGKEIMHGKVSEVENDGTGLFKGLPERFKATRYHSLSVEKQSLPGVLKVNAWTEDGEIMGLRHESRPIHGLQFHPESIASEHGHDLIKAFLELPK